MISFRRQVLLKSLKLFDVAVAALALLLAALVLHDRLGTVSFGQLLAMRGSLGNFLVFLAFLLWWHTSFSIFGLYQSRRVSPRGGDLVDVLRATSLGSLAFVLGAPLLKLDLITPTFLLCFWTISSVIAMASRYALRYGLERVRMHGRNLRHVLIVGANARTIRLAQRLEARPEFGYRLVGFVDDDWDGIRQLQQAGFARVTGLADFTSFLREHVVDEVFVGLPMNSFYRRAATIVESCEEQGVLVRFVSSIFNARFPLRKDKFEDAVVWTVSRGTIDDAPMLLKRILDFCASLTVLTLLAPLFLVTALLIKVTAPNAPIFFVQDRVGLNKRVFRMYKFRTMIPDAESRLGEIEHMNEVNGPVFKVARDPRMTRVGRVLRRLSIDELPQLINVLQGEMSLVGPRPLPVRDYRGFKEDWQRRRFSIRPGITCLWQINGRSSVPFNEWMQLDMQYIDEWSLALDLKILVRTLPAVVKGVGAA